MLARLAYENGISPYHFGINDINRIFPRLYVVGNKGIGHKTEREEGDEDDKSGTKDARLREEGVLMIITTLNTSNMRGWGAGGREGVRRKLKWRMKESRWQFSAKLAPPT